MKEKHVVDSTVSYDHCIGCGICDAVCPHDAIDMIYTDLKEIQPSINENCTECTTCIKYCPFTNEKIFSEAKKVSNSFDANSFGLENSSYYISYDKRDEKRVKSASGGVVTEIAIEMMRRGIIDLVIHAESSLGQIGDIHYQASISRTVDEIENKRSSFYAPISFEKVLKTLSDKEERVLFIGVPCVIRGVNSLFKNHKKFKKNPIFTIALSCSHNVNGQFIDFLAESEDVSKETKFKANLRNKDDLIDANHFKNHFYKNDSYNDSQTILKKDRFDTIFTEIWRNYFFSMNVCNSCSDFWGYTADISIKDAWGKWAEDPLGKSIVVIRNRELDKLFNEDSNLYKEREDFEVIANSQEPTTKYKQVYITNRLYKSKFNILNILSGYSIRDKISKLSKNLYLRYGFKKTYSKLKYLIILINIVDIINRIINKMRKNQNPYIKFIKFYIMKLVHIFFYKKSRRSNQIMITGGYGYKNVGDEAQLNATMSLLKEKFPEYRQVILTHDRDYTHKEHGNATVFESPREAFFEHNEISIYSLANLPVKLLFLFTGFLVYINAYFVRAGLPTFFISAKKASLLEELKNSDLLFYSGGGYLTGKTLSRLWDGIFFISYAKVLDVPVVLSGQTIGVWNGTFNKWFAKWGLSKANIITTRDPEDSIEALAEIGIKNSNTFVTFDDALFCDVITEEETQNELKKSGFDIKDFNNYVTLNIHYWGMERDQDAKNRLIERVKSVIDFLVDIENKKVVLIAMTPSDYSTINDYLKEYPNSNVISYQYNFDFRQVRGVIANSNICITMKHHPIIFAVGEKVPVISLANFDYYEHKNGGALKLFEIDEYNLDFSDHFKLENFKNSYYAIFKESSYGTKISKRLIELQNIKKLFIEKTRELLVKR